MDLNFEVSLSCGGKQFNGNIRDILKINESILSKEFCDQPSTYAWFAALAENAGAEVENKRFKCSVLKANLDKQKRLENAEKKVTESVISSAVQVDPAFIKMNEELIELERQHGILKAIVSALNQRSTMLVQLGTMRRQEMALGDFQVSLPKVRSNNQ